MCLRRRRMVTYNHSTNKDRERTATNTTSTTDHHHESSSSVTGGDHACSAAPQPSGPSHHGPTKILRFNNDSLLEEAHERDLSKFSVSLPDLDDHSMNTVFSYLEYYEQDMAWSIASDLCFVVGGVCYVILAIWDAQIRAAQGELAGTDLEAGIEEATNDYRWYPTLDTVAPAVFCVNSWIDLRWACVVQRRQKYKRTLAQRWDAEWAETSAITTTTAVAARTTTTLTTTAEAATTPTSPYYAARDSHQDFIMVVDDEDDFYSSSWWHHCRKHAAHRRTLWAALTFGGAALLALLAVILTRTGSAMNSTQLELASAHLYVASAVICLTGKRTRPWFQSTITKTSGFLSSSDCRVVHNPAQSHYRNWLGLLTYTWRNPELLEDMGDALFLIGSLLDAMLMDFDATAIEESALMGIVASGLWLLDALLYMHSDFVRARQGSTRVERLGREIGSHDDDPPACFV